MSYPQTPTDPTVQLCRHCGQAIGTATFYLRPGYLIHTACRAAFDSPARIRREGVNISTRLYYVVNTSTGADISGPFDTVGEAQADMYRRFPAIDPWDGEDVPVAVDAR